MSQEKDWQRQLVGAVLAAAARTAVEYATNPNARDETVDEMKSKLAKVDYGALAKVLSRAIDQLSLATKNALNEAIDNIQSSAEEAVEAAAEKAQEQLGSSKRRGKGKLFVGIMLGAVAGFFLLNEDRRNQIMDKLTGASGPIDSTETWTPPTPSTFRSSASTAKEESASVANQAASSTEKVTQQATESVKAVTEEASKQASNTAKIASDETKKTTDAATESASKVAESAPKTGGQQGTGSQSGDKKA